MPHTSRGRRPGTKPLHSVTTDSDADAAALWFADDLSCAVCAAPVAPGSLFCSPECRLRDQQSLPLAPAAATDADCVPAYARTHTHEPTSLFALHPPLVPPGASFNALPSPSLSATVRRATALPPQAPPHHMSHIPRRSIGRRSPEHLTMASDSPSVSDAESELPGPGTPSPRLGPLRSPTMRFARQPGATNMPAPVVLASPALTATTRRHPVSASTTPASPWLLVDHAPRHSPRHAPHHPQPEPIPEDSDSDAASCISGFDLGPAVRDPGCVDIHAPGAATAATSANASASNLQNLPRGRLSFDSIAALRQSLRLAFLDGPNAGQASASSQAPWHGREIHACNLRTDDSSPERGRTRRAAVSRGRPPVVLPRDRPVRRAASSDADSRSIVGDEPERGRGRSTARVPRSVSRRRSPSPPRRGDRRASRREERERTSLSEHGPLMPIQPMYAGVEVGALAMALHSVTAAAAPSPRRKSSRAQSHGRATPLTDRSVSRSPCSPTTSSSVLGRGRALSLHLIRGSHPPAVCVSPHGR